MLRSRIIPCLLIKGNGLVKTTQFDNPKYVGDPINAVKIFNEKSVDELIVLDIDATTNKSEPNYDLIRDLAVECRMPLCYGGGVKTVETFEKIISLGVEKVSISSAAVVNPNIIAEAAKVVGRQSVVVVIDVRKKRFGNRYEIVTDNGKKSHKIDLVEFLRLAENLGAGEIVVNSIDRDGVMKGYDLNLIEKVYDSVSLPVTALGGVGSIEDMKKLIDLYAPIGAAAGSFFVFKGKYRAVLISYPNANEKDEIVINKGLSFETDTTKSIKW